MSREEQKNELIQQLVQLSELRGQLEQLLAEAHSRAQELAAELHQVSDQITSVEGDLYQVYAGQFAEITPNSLAGAVVSVMRASGGAAWTTREVADRIGADPAVVRATLSDMTRRGILERVARGVYRIDSARRLPPG